MRVQRLEDIRQRAQRLLDDQPHRPQRMIRRHPGLQIDIAEQTTRLPNLTAHHRTPHLVDHLF